MLLSLANKTPSRRNHFDRERTRPIAFLAPSRLLSLVDRCHRRSGALFHEPTIAVYSYSVFLKAVSQDFHVGRGAVALAFTFHNLCTASLTPIIGYMIERFGAKRIVVPATALVGLTAIFAKLIGAALWQYYVFYVALGVLGPAAGPVPYSAVISRWFDRKRGLALGLMSFGSGLAAIGYPPVAQLLIAQSGWRSAYAIWVAL
jgi:MFS family permease